MNLNSNEKKKKFTYNNLKLNSGSWSSSHNIEGTSNKRSFNNTILVDFVQSE